MELGTEILDNSSQNVPDQLPPVTTVSANHTSMQEDKDASKEIEEETQPPEVYQDLDNSEYLDKLFLLDKENKQLKCKIEALENSLVSSEADLKAEHLIQLDSLEKIINQQKLEIERTRNDAAQREEASAKQFSQAKTDLDFKVDKLTKQLEQVSKERDAMVMKYAVSEKSAITLQGTIKQLENKCREYAKEKEGVLSKLAVVTTEKSKLSSTIDEKEAEIIGIGRELQKKKDELHLQSSSLKFFQNKLKLESDKAEEVKLELEKTKQKLREAREETEQVRKNGQEMLRRYETDGRKMLEMKDAEEVTSLQEQLELCREKYQTIEEERDSFSKRVQALEAEKLDHEGTFAKLKQCESDYQNCLLEVQNLRAELESTRDLLNRELERLKNSQTDVDRLKQANNELQVEMDKCRERESELLSFTQMLTEKNVAMQSEFSGFKTTIQELETTVGAVSRQLEAFKYENISLKDELDEERKQRSEEKVMLTRHLDEKTSLASQLSQKLEDQIDENRLLKKKHLASTKELTRELQSLRKKADTSDTISLSLGSHTSSNTSLNIIEPSENRTAPPPAPVLPTEPDRQLLIEKIVKIQRSNARKHEKIEFLEEHSRQLVAELQKKSKIIQSLVMKHQTGALSSDEMDNNKIALAKHGGVMASVYNSKPTDESITLELSLEINRKLQAVLEDTLLKNITLKDNMETLGNEIARLASQQSR